MAPVHLYMKKKILILDTIRSAYNVGAMFRTADGVGVEKLYLVGYTPAPLDRFGRVQSEIAKTSLGATESVAWEQVATDAVVELVQNLQADGYTVVAVEQDAKAVGWADFQVPERVAYVVGNETDGVSQMILDAADQILELPMHGQKESLNVSVTAGIVLYRD